MNRRLVCGEVQPVLQGELCTIRGSKSPSHEKHPQLKLEDFEKDPMVFSGRLPPD